MRKSKYTKEFKDSAIQLVMNGEKPASHIAKDLGMNDKTLSLFGLGSIKKQIILEMTI
jgi:transposase-like protein